MKRILSIVGLALVWSCLVQAAPQSYYDYRDGSRYLCQLDEEAQKETCVNVAQRATQTEIATGMVLTIVHQGATFHASRVAQRATQTVRVIVMIKTFAVMMCHVLRTAPHETQTEVAIDTTPIVVAKS